MKTWIKLSNLKAYNRQQSNPHDAGMSEYTLFSDQLGSEWSDGVPCGYRRARENEVLIVALYVDDLLIAVISKSRISLLKSILSAQFDMKDPKEAKSYLGMEKYQHRKAKVPWLNQEHYMDEILERFGMSECKPVFAPPEAVPSNT